MDNQIETYAKHVFRNTTKQVFNDRNKVLKRSVSGQPKKTETMLGSLPTEGTDRMKLKLPSSRYLFLYM